MCWRSPGAKAFLAMFGLMLALASPADAEEPARPRPPIVFSGNLVLNDEVYLAVLDLPADFVPDKDGAALVRSQLLSFLQRAGYEIARVETAVDGGRILVDIDEGRVEKVILRGQGSLRTVQALLGLSIPHNIFNRPYLERQLSSLRLESGLELENFELVHTTTVRHLGPQVEDLGPIVDDIGRFVGHPLIPPRADYELHILFRRREWATGPGIVAGLSGVDGLRLGLEYRGESLWLREDRWGATAQLGAKIRSRLADERAYPALTRAIAELQWYTPRLSQRLRPVLSARGELTSRQRPDIGLESYYATRVQLTAGLSYELFHGALFALSLGAEEFDVFSLRPVEGGERPRVVGSVGPSFHVLIADVFQLDLYYAIGLAGHGEAERGFTAALKQAF